MTRGAPKLDLLVKQYIRKRRALGELSKGTARNHRLTLLTFAKTFGERPVSHLGRSHVETWLETITPLSPGTRRQRLSVVKCFCRWLVMEGYVKRDPSLGVRSPRQPKAAPRVLQQADVVKLLNFVPDARARLIVLLQVQLGLRCCEVSNLELGDISDNQIRVRGKFGNERNLPLVPEVRKGLTDYLSERGNRGGPLIQNYQYQGRGLTAHTIGDRMRTWMIESGVKQRAFDGKSAHGLRRTCATDMLAAGADIIDRAEALGHQNLGTVRHYAKYDTRRLQEAMAGRVYTRTSPRQPPSPRSGQHQVGSEGRR